MKLTGTKSIEREKKKGEIAVKKQLDVNHLEDRINLVLWKVTKFEFLKTKENVKAIHRSFKIQKSFSNCPKTSTPGTMLNSGRCTTRTFFCKKLNNLTGDISFKHKPTIPHLYMLSKWSQYINYLLVIFNV